MVFLFRNNNNPYYPFGIMSFLFSSCMFYCFQLDLNGKRFFLVLLPPTSLCEICLSSGGWGFYGRKRLALLFYFCGVSDQIA